MALQWSRRGQESWTMPRRLGLTCILEMGVALIGVFVVLALMTRQRGIVIMADALSSMSVWVDIFDVRRLSRDQRENVSL